MLCLTKLLTINTRLNKTELSTNHCVMIVNTIYLLVQGFGSISLCLLMLYAFFCYLLIYSKCEVEHTESNDIIYLNDNIRERFMNKLWLHPALFYS